jgi:ribonuclease VapC
MSERIVFDASAVLAIIFAEPGEERALDLAGNALVSTVNLSEAAAKLDEQGFDPAETRLLLEAIGLGTASFEVPDAFDAGRLRRATRASGLSFGDRACLALALRERLPVATADRAFAEVDVGVLVEMIR